MFWVAVDVNLKDSNKVKRLRNALGLADVYAAMGRLQAFWGWCTKNADKEGRLRNCTADDIADAFGWRGSPSQLINALMTAGEDGRPGFIEYDTDGRTIIVHDWAEEQKPLYALKAKQEADALRKWKERHPDNPEDERQDSHAECPPDSPMDKTPDSPMDNPPECRTQYRNLNQNQEQEPEDGERAGARVGMPDGSPAPDGPDDMDDKNGGKSKPDLNRPPYAEICELYAQICPMMPHMMARTDKREKLIKARWRQFKGDLSCFRECFSRAAKSSFLTGVTSRPGWIADFDYLMRSDNMLKVLEGGYDNHKSTGPPRGGVHDFAERDFQNQRVYTAADFSAMAAQPFDLKDL